MDDLLQKTVCCLSPFVSILFCLLFWLVRPECTFYASESSKKQATPCIPVENRGESSNQKRHDPKSDISLTGVVNIGPFFLFFYASQTLHIFFSLSSFCIPFTWEIYISKEVISPPPTRPPLARPLLTRPPLRPLPVIFPRVFAC